MTTASPTAKPAIPAKASESSKTGSTNVLVPYVVAIFAQLPLLILYFKSLWGRPHYQPFAIAILAVVGIAFMRWPLNQERPYHRSVASDVLFWLGIAIAVLGLIFVEPWFAAFSSMLIVASLFARTVDKETLDHETPTSLWPCALPLFVYLTLPGGLDVRLITTLQRYSAIYTSRLLDLLGLPHHMNGVVISVPGLQDYGIEEACSGVQSFFTLMLVAVVYIIWTRRLRVPSVAAGVIAVFVGLFCVLLHVFLRLGPGISETLLIGGIGAILFAFTGFRATALLLTAVFWAVFMNTIRILLIPLTEYFFEFDLSHGVAHDILGYSSLVIGILMLISTDQFLYFLFGPVEVSTGESGPFGRGITRFWNNLIAGNDQDEDGSQRRRRSRRARSPISPLGRSLIWVGAASMALIGLVQLWDVSKSYNTSDISVNFFDVDVMVPFDKTDLPVVITAPIVDGVSRGSNWEQPQENAYAIEDRTRGSDLGQRSDIWQFRSPRCAAVASLDQTFPGWHELTTCYKNQGWTLKSRNRKVPPKPEGADPSEREWPYIEALFEKSTGEKGLLLFSHFNAVGEGMDAPQDWGTLNSFLHRAKGRLGHRWRAALFQGEAYQTQVFLNSFNGFDDEVKQEATDRYLEIREQLRQRFIEKKKAEQGAA